MLAKQPLQEVRVYLLKAGRKDGEAIITIYCSDGGDDDYPDGAAAGRLSRRQNLQRSMRFLGIADIPLRCFRGLELLLPLDQRYIHIIEESQRLRPRPIPSPELPLARLDMLPEAEGLFFSTEPAILLLRKSKMRAEDQLADATVFYRAIARQVLANQLPPRVQTRFNDLANIGWFIEAASSAFRRLEEEALQADAPVQITDFYLSLGGLHNVLREALATLGNIMRGNTPTSLTSIYSFIHVSFAMGIADTRQIDEGIPLLNTQSELDLFRNCLASEPEEKGMLSPRQLFDKLNTILWSPSNQGIQIGNISEDSEGSNRELDEPTRHLPNASEASALSDGPGQPESFNPLTAGNTSLLGDRNGQDETGSVVRLPAPQALVNGAIFQRAFRFISNFDITGLIALWMCIRNFGIIELLSRYLSASGTHLLNSYAQSTEPFLLLASRAFRGLEYSTTTSVTHLYEGVLLYLVAVIQVCRSLADWAITPLIRQQLHDSPAFHRYTPTPIKRRRPFTPGRPFVGSFEDQQAQKSYPSPPESDKFSETATPGVSSTYKCCHCNVVASKTSEIRKHLAYVHNEKPKFTCPIENCEHSIAENAFLEESRLKEHLEQHVQKLSGREWESLRTPAESDILVGECAESWAARNKTTILFGDLIEVSFPRSEVDEAFSLLVGLSVNEDTEVPYQRSPKRKRWSQFSKPHSHSEASFKRRRLESSFTAPLVAEDAKQRAHAPETARSLGPASMDNIPVSSKKRKPPSHICDVDGCGMALSTMCNLRRHKRQKHGDEQIHTCNYHGCTIKFTGDRGFLRMRKHQKQEHGETCLNTKRRTFK